MTQKLYLVDASGYIFRAYYAIRPLSNSRGLPTNALYGFTTMLLKLLREERPDHIGVVFDVARKTFRTEKFPAYKANRAEVPPDLIPQFPYFRKIVRALNIPALELENFEADDVIGTIVKKISCRDKALGRRSPHEADEGGCLAPTSIVIVTGDKDMMQLVDSNVVLFDGMKEKWIGEREVREKFGVSPAQVVDVLGLAGDPSDNIPGVPGIGEKTAMKLVSEYGSIEKTIENAGKIKGKVGERLVEFADQARLCKELVTIVTDAPIEYDYRDFAISRPDEEALRALFSELEFRTLLSEVTPKKSLSKEKYRLILHPKEMEQLAEELKGCGFSFDTETTAIDTMKASLVGISVSCREGEASYIPVGHSYDGVPVQLSWDEVCEKLKPLLEDPKLPKYAQNAKYDYEILKRHGIEVCGLTEDTMIASYLLNPEGSHNLAALAQTYFGHKVVTCKEVVGKKESFAEVDLETACDYSCEDADVTFRLARLLPDEIKKQGLDDLYRNIELPLAVVLAKMETNGVRIDGKTLQETSREYDGKLGLVEKRVHEIAGVPFNLKSPKQLGEVLFEKMMLPVKRRTKTGYSTDVDVLTELASSHEIARLLLEYRSLSKLKSTYLDALPALVNPATGRIHASFNQAIAATGRLSSNNPNLQNIPVRTEEGKRIREAFIAEKGRKILSADYSQIELRILASLSGDEELLDSFASGRDVHNATASGIFGVQEEDVTDDMRAVGKTVNFAVVYGQSAYGLSEQLGIKVSEAERYIKNYYERYKGVADYKEKILEEVRRDKKVHTLFGRQRIFPEILSPNVNVRQMAERTAFNTIFQGSAADLIKKAMIRIQKRIEEEFPDAMMIIQVHDELVFEVPEREVTSFAEMVREEMEGAEKLKVSLKVDIGVGDNWAEAH